MPQILFGRWLLIMGGGFFMLSMAACARNTTGKDAATTQTIPASLMFEKKDNGKSIVLKPGEEFEIHLKGVPTAGYSWKIMDMDKSKIQMLKEEAQSMTPPGMVGGSSMFVWRFRATDAGESSLILKYFRPWEGVGQSLETFTLQVKTAK